MRQGLLPRRFAVESAGFAGIMIGACLSATADPVLAAPAFDHVLMLVLAGACGAALMAFGWSRRREQHRDAQLRLEMQVRRDAEQRAEALRVESEREVTHWRSILDAANAAVLVVDSNVRVTEANTLAERFLDRERHALIGKTFGDAIRCSQLQLEGAECGSAPDCPRCMVRLSVGKVRATGLPARIPELQIDPADGHSGEPRIVETSVSPVQGGSGSLLAVSMFDITELKNAQRTIRREKEISQALLDATRSQSFLLDTEGRLLLSNAAAKAALGEALESLTGRLLWDLLPEELAAQRKAFFEKAVAEKTPVRFDDTHQDRVFGNAYYPVFDAEGKVLHVAAHCANITGRKKAEQAARHLAAIVESSQEAIVSLSPEGKVLSWNNGAESLYLYAQSEMLGQPFQRLSPPGRERDIAGIIEKLLAGKEYQNVETVLLSKAGELLEVSMVVAPLRNEAGGIAGISTIAHDITQNKQAEAALRRSEERFRSVTETTGSIVWEADAEYRFTFMGDKVRDLLGYTPEECAGKYFFSLVPAEEVADLRRTIDFYFADGETVMTLEHRALRKQGGEIWLSTVGAFQRDAKGDWEGLRGVSNDITERKFMEMALQENEARFRAMTSAAQDAIIMIDNSGTILFWNDAAERIFGWNEGEIIGRNARELLTIPLWPGLGEDEAGGGGTAAGRLVEFTGRRKDGTEFPAEVAMSSVKHRGEWCSVHLLRDITERKRVERELQKAIAHAQEMAEHARRADAAKSEFLANMSHEIRTPMNGVIGMTTLLFDTVLDPAQYHCAKVIRSSGEALLGIIDDILDFSKIEAGRLELECIPFDLHATMAEFADLMSVRAEEKQVEFAYAVEEGVPEMVCGDPGRLRQILVNLAGNAIKFTARGEVTVRISREPQADRETKLRFAVRDTGLGIPADRVESLFTAFTQVDASTTRKYGGTGLGLAISKRLAELMQGEIGVTSQLGQGSEFWFTAVLPIDSETVLKEPVPFPVPLGRWLVADAFPAARRFLARQLETLGGECEQVDSHAAALEALWSAASKQRPFRGVIVDANLPGGALDLGAAVKGNREWADTAMILKASLSQRQTAQNALDLGFATILPKPVLQPGLFRSALQTALGLQAESMPSAPAPQTATPGGTSRPLRLLVAEDNVVNQKVACGILERMGHRVDCVSNGREAVEAVRTGHYDIVLMDCQMPEMDGYEATAAIRSLDPARSRVPIIALTANAMRGDRDRCLEAGMDGYLSKPIRTDETLRELQRLTPRTATEPVTAAREPSAVSFFVEDFIDRMGGQDKLVREVLLSAVHALPALATELGGALDREDWTEARRRAHSIKGLTANIDARPLHAHVGRIEAALTGNEHANARNAYQGLAPLIATLLQDIQAYLSRPGAD